MPRPAAAPHSSSGQIFVVMNRLLSSTSLRHCLFVCLLCTKSPSLSPCFCSCPPAPGLSLRFLATGDEYPLISCQRQYWQASQPPRFLLYVSRVHAIVCTYSSMSTHRDSMFVFAGLSRYKTASVELTHYSPE